MSAIRLFAFFLCLLYGLLTGLYVWDFLERSRTGQALARAALVGTILAHLVFFLGLLLRVHHAIMSAPTQVLSALALAVAVAYFLVEAATRERGMGVWVLGTAFGFQLISAIGADWTAEPNDLPGSPLLGIHIGLALVGYCAFALSMVFSVMYLVLYHEIKIRRLGRIFERLPALETLEEMGYRAVHFGLGFLLVSLVLGAHLLRQQQSKAGLTDSKIYMAAAACVFYAVAIVMRRPWSLRGKRFALTSIAGFVVILVLLFIGQKFSGFHRFH